MSIVWAAFRFWLPAAAAATVLAITAYAMVQQDLRQSANDPQWQMAQDAANALTVAPRAAVVPSTTVSLDTSLAPYLIVLDKNGKVIDSSATLDGSVPTPPIGSLTAATSSSPHWFSWEPAPGVREAAVVVAYPGGYVLGGRSLKLTEDRINNITGLAVLGWLGALGASGLVAIAMALLTERRPIKI